MIGRIASAIVFVMFVGGSSVLADLKEQFLKEYPAAAAKLDAAYSQSRAFTAFTGFDDRGAVRKKSTCEFDRSGQAVREIDTIVESNEAEVPVGFFSVNGGTPEKFFYIYRPVKDQTLQISSFCPRAKSLTAPEVCSPLFAVDYIDNWRLSDAVAKWTTKSAQMDVLDGEKVCRIDFTTIEPTKFGYNEIIEGNVYFFLPSWAVAGWHTTARKANPQPGHPNIILEFQGRVKYSEMAPTPKVSQIHRWRVVGGSRVDERQVDVNKLEFVDLPASDFTLAAFGLSEPASPIIWGENHSQ